MKNTYQMKLICPRGSSEHVLTKETEKRLLTLLYTAFYYLHLLRSYWAKVGEKSSCRISVTAPIAVASSPNLERRISVCLADWVKQRI